MVGMPAAAERELIDGHWLKGARRAGSVLRRTSKRERYCASWANRRDLTRIFGSECMHHDSGYTVACGSLCHVRRTAGPLDLAGRRIHSIACKCPAMSCRTSDLPNLGIPTTLTPLPMLGQLPAMQWLAGWLDWDVGVHTIRAALEPLLSVPRPTLQYTPFPAFSWVSAAKRRFCSYSGATLTLPTPAIWWTVVSV